MTHRQAFYQNLKTSIPYKTTESYGQKTRDMKNNDIKLELNRWITGFYSPTHFLTIQLPENYKSCNSHNSKTHLRMIMKIFEKSLLGRHWNKKHLPFICVAENGTDRITLFTYDYGNKEFILQGRYSPNDKYRENGKFIYPKSGLLYKAFNTDEGVYDDEFPAPFVEGSATITDNYWKYHKKKYGLTKEVVQNLTMKPTVMYGYVIKDHSEGDKIGVVIG